MPFLVTKDHLIDEDLLIGCTVLAHLGIDSRTTLEERFQKLDNMDFSGFQYHTDSKFFCRLLLVRLQHICGQDTKQIPQSYLDQNLFCSNYSSNRREADPFRIHP